MRQAAGEIQGFYYNRVHFTAGIYKERKKGLWQLHTIADFLLFANGSSKSVRL